jgi:hypothetical protein
MDTRLIKANIALFNGSREETRRFLEEYLDDDALDAKQAAMVMWLDAQTLPDRRARFLRLHELVAAYGVDNVYGKLALDTIRDEEKYALPEKHAAKGKTLFGIAIWKIALFLLIVVIALVTVTQLATRGSGTANDSTALNSEQNGSARPTPFPALPDHSQSLEGASYAAQYTEGNLQIVALEDVSERVVSLGEGALISPVPGGRFYALKLLFECRTGICRNPPEADLELGLKDGVAIPPRIQVGIAGDTLLEPIAQGRTTSGWIIFEIPLAAEVTELHLEPVSSPMDAAPLVIVLPAS